MGEHTNVKRLVFCIVVVVSILGFTQFYSNWLLNKNKRNDEFKASRFYRDHVIDPAVEGHRFMSWTKKDWMTFLDSREQGRNAWPPLKQKPLNSLLIASPDEVLGAYESREFPYNGERYGSDPIFWSDRRFPTFVFMGSGKYGKNNIRIFHCPPMFIAAALRENGLPCHLQYHAKQRITGNEYRLKLTTDCVEIQN